MGRVVPSEFIDNLADAVYTEENVNRGVEYMESRGLDAGVVSRPWAVTSSDPSRFGWHSRYYRVGSFLEYLYIPVLDMRDVSGGTLAGFDMRYVGSGGGSRFLKFKRDPVTPLVYGVDSLVLCRGRREVWVAESAIDAESLRLAGFPCVSPLSALHGPRWLSVLLGMADVVHLCYDKDDRGVRAEERLLELGALYGGRLVTHSYMGKDPNDALRLGGVDYMRGVFGGG